jgi:hypothetical protein
MSTVTVVGPPPEHILRAPKRSYRKNVQIELLQLELYKTRVELQYVKNDLLEANEEISQLLFRIMLAGK